MTYLTLFWSFFQIGLFSVGGGYAAMPFIQHQVVELHPWLTLEEFAHVVAIAEMTPGPIAINAATFVGIRIGGIPGALTATAGCVLPSCILVLALAWAYYRFRGLALVQGVLAGLRPAVTAMIASAGVTLVGLALCVSQPGTGDIGPLRLASLCLFAAGLALLRLRKASPLAVLARRGSGGGDPVCRAVRKGPASCG